MSTKSIVLAIAALVVSCSVDSPSLSSEAKKVSSSSKHDWPMYNYSEDGSRHNKAENRLNRNNVDELEEKWRFPAEGSSETIGIVSISPVVVDGFVYFGTSSGDFKFYRLNPDGTESWSFQMNGPIFNSPVVKGDTVYLTEFTGPTVYALDKSSGAVQWLVDLRDEAFLDSIGRGEIYHPTNASYGSGTMLVDGKVIVTGGAREQIAPAFNPAYECCTGRGFVVAIDPVSGDIEWHYMVGEAPQPLVPTIDVKDAYGANYSYSFGPTTSTVWSTPTYDRHTKTLYFGTEANNSPRQPTADNPKLHTEYSDAIVALDVATGAEKWVTQLYEGDVWHLGFRIWDNGSGSADICTAPGVPHAECAFASDSGSEVTQGGSPIVFGGETVKVTRGYKDQSIGDAPKLYRLANGRKVVGAANKLAFFVLDAATGEFVSSTDVLDTPPVCTLNGCEPALQGVDGVSLGDGPEPVYSWFTSAIGGMSTGQARYKNSIILHGIDGPAGGNLNPFGRNLSRDEVRGGGVKAISSDTSAELWDFRPDNELGDNPLGKPVLAGIAVANHVVYFVTSQVADQETSKFYAINAKTGELLNKIDLGVAALSGPAVSNGRVYLGTGTNLGGGAAQDSLVTNEGTLRSYGLPCD